jgi:hypothetical protein
MPAKRTITILNHGTMNSNDDDLVITALDYRLSPTGPSGRDWMANAGVGTYAQAGDRDYLPGWNAIGGTFWAKGINKAVDESVAFVRKHCAVYGADRMNVNMAGHSRGSMTALKIAYALQQDDETKGCDVNLFLIDPVPGNLGWVNAGMYKDIAIQGNVKHAYMLLAETERRNAFRAYVDRKFLDSLPTHRMDTVPGNHGGINELNPDGLHEAADVVLHHAVTFLKRHGTVFHNPDRVTKTPEQLSELYATIMLDFQKYKKQGGKLQNTIYNVMGGVASGDRTVQKAMPNKPANWLVQQRGLAKDKVGGVGMTTMQHESLAGLNKETRFFANLDHKAQFRVTFPSACGYIEKLETGGTRQQLDLMLTDPAFYSDRDRMGENGRQHLAGWQRQLSRAM